MGVGGSATHGCARPVVGDLVLDNLDPEAVGGLDERAQVSARMLFDTVEIDGAAPW